MRIAAVQCHWAAHTIGSTTSYHAHTRSRRAPGTACCLHKRWQADRAVGLFLALVGLAFLGLRPLPHHSRRREHHRVTMGLRDRCLRQVSGKALFLQTGSRFRSEGRGWRQAPLRGPQDPRRAHRHLQAAHCVNRHQGRVQQRRCHSERRPLLVQRLISLTVTRNLPCSQNRR